MDPIKPFLNLFNDIKSAENPSREKFRELKRTATSLAETMRDKGTKLARDIADHEGGSKGNASMWFHHLEELLNSDFKSFLRLDSKGTKLDDTLNKLREAASRSVKDFTNFFRTDEAILKEKVGFSSKGPKSIFATAA